MTDKTKAEKVRKEYIKVEAMLLDRLSGKELELLNELIELDCEYHDLMGI